MFGGALLSTSVHSGEKKYVNPLEFTGFLNSSAIKRDLILTQVTVIDKRNLFKLMTHR